ncbi:hypothetical protein CA85_32990 [Allorhodopirellula solitaria]|uniref:Uncharacterized protein n=1 Tax=Allorhodopirellula solitaria TaxID=2527987 RepID=A0A5C5XTM9_9BACT|nr:hypothetical protein CA85_32990 [Allorhodopirellula solitaria]
MHVVQIKLLSNFASDSFAVLLNVLVCEPQHLPPTLFQVSLTPQITLDVFIVISTIYFDDQHFGDARKIGKPRPDRVFTAKLQATQLFGTKYTP